MTRLPAHRVDELDSAALASVPDLTGARAGELFASPQRAIATLAEEFRAVWRARSRDWAARPIGSIGLASGAYVQWIGYRDRVVVEVSSNEFLDEAHRLHPDEEQQLAAYGFAHPDEHSPNFAATIDDPVDAERLALRVVAVLTVVFGVYVG